MMKDKKNPDCTIGVEYAYSGNENEMLKEVIHFPTDKDTIVQLLKNAGVDGIHESILYIESMDTDIPGLDDALLDSIGFDELNYLAGDYMDDANYNINVLLDKRGNEYLMLITNDNIFLTEAHAYWQGTATFDIWTNTAQCSDVRAFAIHVKDQMSEVIGSIAEIDFAERQRDILDNSIKYTSVSAMLKYGEKKTFTAAEWDNISPAMSDRIEKQTMQYHPSDLHSVREHLQIANKGSNAIEKVVELDILLTAINRAYTERSPIKRSDLMHITQLAAKELLARDDIQVYRSLPEGVKRLSSLDAMPNRGDSIEQHLYEFAIKCNDLVGLDKWAKRVLGAVEAKRQQKRDILSKSNSRDNEL